MTAERKSAIFLACFFGLLAVLAVALPPVQQNPNYHHFAQDSTWLGIPHFWNVLSNLAFALVAIHAFWNSKREQSAVVFQVGVFATAFGSAYYHWNPTDPTLFWDRLPMTIAFSGVVAALVERRVNEVFGRRMLWPLLIVSAFTVVSWRTNGNLVPYGIVQFGTVLLVLLILLFFPRHGSEQNHLWLGLAAYVAAKLLEHFDQPLGQTLHVMGGHPIKHVAAALGCWFINAALFARAAKRTESI